MSFVVGAGRDPGCRLRLSALRARRTKQSLVSHFSRCRAIVLSILEVIAGSENRIWWGLKFSSKLPAMKQESSSRGDSSGKLVGARQARGTTTDPQLTALTVLAFLSLQLVPLSTRVFCELPSAKRADCSLLHCLAFSGSCSNSEPFPCDEPRTGESLMRLHQLVVSASVYRGLLVAVWVRPPFMLYSEH